MKHKLKGRQFKRSKSQKKALMKHLSEAIILQEKITTTTAKAKELSSYVEKLITVAKKKNLLAAKAIHGKLSDEASKKLLLKISNRYNSRNGGYTRIIKISERKGDVAQMSVIEFV
ncbi:MAG: 50S ribosomal protein L17 [Candidatus Pacebacteria bacterium]|nr:50S ribosomal protein L17 [Candidatus Paceibacterota bacterium]